MTAVKIALAFVLSATAFAAAASNHIAVQDIWAGKWRMIPPIPETPVIAIIDVAVSPPDADGMRTFDIWGRCVRRIFNPSGANFACKWGSLRTKFNFPAQLLQPAVQGPTYVPCDSIVVSFSPQGGGDRDGADFIISRIWSGACQPPNFVPLNANIRMRRIPNLQTPLPDATVPETRRVP